MTKRRWLMLALGAAAVLLIVGRALAGVYADYLWYESLGAVALWRARLGAIATLRVGSVLAAGLFAFANLYAVRQSVVSLVLPAAHRQPRDRRRGAGPLPHGRRRRALAGPRRSARAAADRTGRRSCSRVSGRPFGEADPYFDAGSRASSSTGCRSRTRCGRGRSSSIIVVIVAVIALYALTPSLKWQRGSLYASTYVRRHFTVLVGVLLLMLAWSFRLDMYALLLDGSGVGRRVQLRRPPRRNSGRSHLSLDDARRGADRAVGRVRRPTAARRHRGAERRSGCRSSFARSRRAIVAALRHRRGARAARAAVPRHARDVHATRVRRRRGAARRLDDRAIRRSPRRCRGCRCGIRRRWRARSTADAPATSRTCTIGWRTSPIGLLADVVDPPPPGASARAPWTLARIIAAAADERGAPLRVAGPRVGDRRHAARSAARLSGRAAVHRHRRLADPQRRHVARAGSRARLAIAWSLQNFRILSTDLRAAASDDRRASRRARPRRRCSRRSSRRGGRSSRCCVGDSLYWAVDLYSASSTLSAQPAHQLRRRRPHVSAPRRRGDRSGVDGRHQHRPRFDRSIRSRDTGCSGSRRSSRRGARCRRASARCSRRRSTASRAQAIAFGRYGSQRRTTIRRGMCRRSTARTRAWSTDPLPDRAARGQDDRARAAAGRRDRPAARPPDRHRRHGAPTVWYPLADAGPALERGARPPSLRRQRRLGGARWPARAGPRARGAGSRRHRLRAAEVPVAAADRSDARVASRCSSATRRGRSCRATGSCAATERARAAPADLTATVAGALRGDARRAAARRLGRVRPRVRRARPRARQKPPGSRPP